MSGLNALLTTWFLALAVAGMPQLVYWIVQYREERMRRWHDPEVRFARFAARVGMTPEQYREAVRIENAEILRRLSLPATPARRTKARSEKISLAESN
jgi:hypothetical protein